MRPKVEGRLVQWDRFTLCVFGHGGCELGGALGASPVGRLLWPGTYLALENQPGTLRARPEGPRIGTLRLPALTHLVYCLEGDVPDAVDSRAFRCIYVSPVELAALLDDKREGTAPSTFRRLVLETNPETVNVLVVPYTSTLGDRVRIVEHALRCSRI